MGFSLLNYTALTAGASVDLDMTALTDQDFSIRNGHYIFTEQYQLLAHSLHGVTVTRGNVQVPHWNAIGRLNIWPVNRLLLIPSPPQVAWLRQAPPWIPQNEEYTVKVTTTGAAEQDTYMMWVATNAFNANIPANQLIIPVRFTAAPTLVANAWSAAVALTMEQSLRGGTYAVVGAQVQCPSGLAFRLIFPKYKLAYGNRKLRPGWITQQSLGDLEEATMQINPFVFGEWGRFFTFEQPQIEFNGSTAGAQTAEGRLWLAYLGESDLTGMAV